MADINTMGFGHMFPYSNIHELNLDWLLAKVKELEEKVLDLERRMEEAERRLDDHEARIEYLEEEFAKLRAEWADFKAYIEARFDQLEAEIRVLFQELEARIDARFEQLEHALNDRFTTLENELKTEIQEILQYIINTCAEFTDKVTRLTVRVENLEEQMEECCLTITGKLEEILVALDGVNPELREIVITQNGTYFASDEGATGYYKVTVQVEGGSGVQAVLESLNITANGTYTPPSGVDGYNEIVVNVPAVSDRVAEAKTITQNGTTNTPAGKFYDPITVNVPQRTKESKTITANGTTNTPSGVYYDPIVVDVPAVSDRTKQAKTITANGTTNTPSGVYYDPITVSVPQRTKQSKSITANGTTSTPDGVYYDPIVVNVPQTNVQSLTDSITAGTSNKTYSKTAPSGSAYTPISITVAPTPSESKTVTQNGTVTPSSGKLLSSVVVAVPEGIKTQDTIYGNALKNSPLGSNWKPQKVLNYSQEYTAKGVMIFVEILVTGYATNTSSKFTDVTMTDISLYIDAANVNGATAHDQTITAMASEYAGRVTAQGDISKYIFVQRRYYTKVVKFFNTPQKVKNVMVSLNRATFSMTGSSGTGLNTLASMFIEAAVLF